MGDTTLTEKDFDRLKGLLITLLERAGNDVFCMGYDSHKEYINELRKIDALDKLFAKLLNSNGFCYKRKNKRDFMIFYNDLLKTDERLEVLAHESGHGLLGHNDRFSSKENARLEWEADFFSAMFIFVAHGAIPILQSWNREHVYSGLSEGGA